MSPRVWTLGEWIEYGIYAVILLTCLALVAWNELVAKPRAERNRQVVERQRAADIREWRDR